jgi:hypothetical protein
MNDNVINMGDARAAFQHASAHQRLKGSGMPDWLIDAVIAYGKAHNSELAKHLKVTPSDDPLVAFNIQSEADDDQTWMFSVLGAAEGDDDELRAFTLRVIQEGEMDFVNTDVVHSGRLTDGEEIMQPLQPYFDWLTTAVGEGGVPSLLGTLPALFAYMMVYSLVIRKRMESNGEFTMFFWRTESVSGRGDFLEVRVHFDTIEALNNRT